jgi:hypothetical protein
LPIGSAFPRPFALIRTRSIGMTPKGLFRRERCDPSGQGATHPRRQHWSLHTATSWV